MFLKKIKNCIQKSRYIETLKGETTTSLKKCIYVTALVRRREHGLTSRLCSKGNRDVHGDLFSSPQR